MRRVMLAAWAAVAACGGGSGGDSTGTSPPPAPAPPAQATLTGWTGEREAWAQATITLTCADGSEAQAVSSREGRYTATVPAAGLPCLAQARKSDNASLWSAALAAGTVNVTTLSDALLARLLQQPTNGLFGDAGLARRLSAASVAEADVALRAALADVDLGTAASPLTTPIGTSADDPLVRANGRLLDHLSARGMTALTLVHALAYQRNAGALRMGLAEGDLGRMLALPTAVDRPGLLPDAVRSSPAQLSGTSAVPFLSTRDVTFRGSDGGRRWEPIGALLSTVTDYRGLLLGLSRQRLMISSDAGRTWAAVAGGPSGLGFAHFVKPEDGRLWVLTDAGPAYASADGLHWQSATPDEAVRDAQFYPWRHRAPPLRSVTNAGNGTVLSCLASACTSARIADWTEIWSIHAVQGSDEFLAHTGGGGGGERLAISSDGLTWRPIGSALIGPNDRALRTSTGRLLVSGPPVKPLVTDDEGATWQTLDITPHGDWQALGAASQLRRRVPSELELSTDGGQHWRMAPLTINGDVLLDVQRSPAGLALRQRGPGLLELSEDGGITWAPTSLGELGSFAWLGDRFAVIDAVNGLRTSRDGRTWTVMPRPEMPLFLPRNIAGDGRTWLWRFQDRPSGTSTSLLESRDQGRTWAAPELPDPAARSGGVFSCDGGLYLGVDRGLWLRVYPSGWRQVPLPVGAFAIGCERGLLLAETFPSDHDRHLASADRGLTWTPIGRPGTTQVFDGERWWSIGPTSMTLWP
ncbi:hypothetical protein HLB44_19225 [Aquincola sp. S2]|uniref:Photosynthesis system II assembly factor Ycf48/Hcf136-like domain-containing protein n=1 Tax=Pseudaquabacterium terrae TaxID=2732868 RepID=A0ABX2EKN6_9BURK|nr:hypothetical protein [Aquabacterium terrae]NRF69131.1 hypothetical protein [Aquabacterium terrae]